MTQTFTIPGSASVVVNDDGSAHVSFTGSYFPPAPEPATPAPVAEAPTTTAPNLDRVAPADPSAPVAASSSTDAAAPAPELAPGATSAEQYNTVEPLPPAPAVEQPAEASPAAEGDGSTHAGQG